MKILQVSATDFGGGAAKVAWDLHHTYTAQGNISWLAVGKKKTANIGVVEIPNNKTQNLWEVAAFGVAQHLRNYVGKIPGAGRGANFFRALGRPANTVAYLQGKELFDYPGTRYLLKLVPSIPDVLHAHNLHSKYFDLRLLPQLSQQIPTILTLHDTWLLSGHCAYSVTCSRWEIGCGKCPDLSLYPAVRRDNTAQNWKLKQKLYANSKLYVVTPCKWLMNKVEASMLQQGIVQQAVIHNGVDLDRFSPGDKAAARQKIGLDGDEFIALFVANSVRNNIWKDFATLKRAFELLSARLPHAKIRLICFGDESPQEYAGHIPITFVPHTDNLDQVVDFYRAADVYVHATKADTFPTVILEALACGLPVIATAVDGITEQIKSLCNLEKIENFMQPVVESSINEATGALVKRGEAEGLTHWVEQLINNSVLRAELGINARRDAEKRFDFKRQVREYLDWYQSSSDDFNRQSEEIKKGGAH